jgi:RNA polymerase sigma-70 factor (ECF subfamily)
MMAVAMSSAFPRPVGKRADERALERQILLGCRAQDAAAYREFVVRHERMVFALLSRMLGRGSEVEDLAQETFVRAYRAFPSFDPDGAAKVSTWLLTIATRLALDSRKRRRLDVRSMDDSSTDVAEQAASSASATTPDKALERRELGEALERAASALPDDQRAALLLATVHGFSIEEIAEALDAPASTVKTKLFRAREKMRAALSAEWRTS